MPPCRGVLAVLVAVSNVAAVLALEVVMALVVSALFVVGHDAAHGALFSSKRMNSTVAHLAFLPSFHVYEGWILGHNRVHHPYTVRRATTSCGTPSRPRSSPHWAGGGGPSTASSGPGSLRRLLAHQVWWKKMMVGGTPPGGSRRSGVTGGS